MISKLLVKKEVKENRWIIVIGLCLLLIIAVLNVALYDWIRSYLASVSYQLNDAPSWIKSLVGDLNKLSDYTYATWANWNPKNLIQIGGLVAILLGMTSFAGESENNTISFLLTNNLSRREIFWGKVLAGLSSLLVVFILPTLLLPIMSRLFDTSLQHYRIVGASMVTYCGGVILYSLAAYFSVKTEDRVKAGLATLVVVIVIFGVGMVPGLESFSLFHYTPAASYYFGVLGFPWLTVAVLLSLGSLILWQAQRKFMSKDL